VPGIALDRAGAYPQTEAPTAIRGGAWRRISREGRAALSILGCAQDAGAYCAYCAV